MATHARLSDSSYTSKSFLTALYNLYNQDNYVNKTYRLSLTGDSILTVGDDINKLVCLQNRVMAHTFSVFLVLIRLGIKVASSMVGQ